MIKIGFSLDSHAFKEGKGFMLGGVFVESDVSVIANSDGDCLYHALAEAILGAMKLGSLGDNYPETSLEYKDKDSSYFVRDAYKRMREKGFRINNIDCQIMLDKPKIRKYIPLMEENIARLLECDVSLVSVKPTTLEGLSNLSSKGVTCIASLLITNED